jgi:hypothetical protein
MQHIEQSLCSILAAVTAVGLAAAQALAEGVTGEIVSIDARTVSIRDADGQATRYEIDPQIEVASPIEPLVTVLDLRSGQAVTVTFDDAPAGAVHPTAVRIDIDGGIGFDRKERLDWIASELGAAPALDVPCESC